MEKDRFLLASQIIQLATGNDYIISSNLGNVAKENSTNIIGKLSSNFFNTDFKLYYTQPPCNGTVSSTNHIFG